MGTAERFHSDSAAASEKSYPGPGTYTLRSAQGRQVTSDKPSYAVNSFPRADRDKTATTVYIGKAHTVPASQCVHSALNAADRCALCVCYRYTLVRRSR